MSNLVTKFVVKYNVMGRYLTQEEVITRLTNTFGDKLDISKVKYIDAKTKVKVKCNVCSHEFEAKPLHLFNGHGCPKCARALVGKKCRNSTDKFIEKANKVHNYKYDYSKVTYVTNRVNVCIVCPIHGEFYLTHTYQAEDVRNVYISHNIIYITGCVTSFQIWKYYMNIVRIG